MDSLREMTYLTLLLAFSELHVRMAKEGITSTGQNKGGICLYLAQICATLTLDLLLFCWSVN